MMHGASAPPPNRTQRPEPNAPRPPDDRTIPSVFEQAPAVSLPAGGGAIRGIDEKFKVNPATGSAGMTVALNMPPGRQNFGPQLVLGYDSGSGNGPFGLGWSLSLPAIARKTDRGLPTYQDEDDADTFVLSGAEDLVPTPDPDQTRTIDGESYRVRRYRPRIEGLFTRIERWTHAASGEIHWRAITRDNVTSLYGRTAESRIADPADPARRIFRWLLCETTDDKGNAIRYTYKAEDSAGVDPALAHERNRDDASRAANRYLKRITYGNRTPCQPGEDLALRDDWLFEVVFDYGEGHYTELPPDAEDRELVRASLGETQPWPTRPDAFSTYRPTFEVRTYRLCRRVLIFHHFPGELPVADALTRSIAFTYDEGPVATYLTAITQSGYAHRQDDTFLRESLPPVEFEYSRVPLQDGLQPGDAEALRVREIEARDLENLPVGLDGAQYRFVDLDGEGLSGILTEQGAAWYFKPNLGDGRFGPLRAVAERPASAALSGSQQLLDLAGDGQLDLVELGGPMPGFYERTHERGWTPFAPFDSLPNLNWSDPNLRLVDLTGDGHADALITEDHALAWHPSLGEAGFDARRRVAHALDEERGPRLVFADGAQSIHLADLSGDGLVDLVRIRDGEVCYWPNLGYGRFGAKVAMDGAPHLDSPELLDQRRVRLADVDGSGTADLIYLDADGVHVYFNRAGNSWSPGAVLGQFPAVDQVASVQVVDLLGRGTGCLVWSSPLPGDARRPLRYVDLMDGIKPHLLVGVRNNLGSETRITYAPSTQFYLADAAAGRPWITPLPFPVHVVERMETYDRISRNRFVSRFAYHHGFFDGVEREFRGFGMVEQWDTEEFAALSESDAFPAGDNVEAASHVPPTLTRTWIHTGAFRRGAAISRQFETEYYREPGLTEGQRAAMLLPDTLLPPDLDAGDVRDACRALKGSVLRQEVYALDGTERAGRPYTVSERTYAVRRLQPRRGDQPGVYLVHPREVVDFHYERTLFDVEGEAVADPRVTHAVTLDVDDFGNVRQAVAISYGRRYADPDPLLTSDDHAKQSQPLITLTEHRYTNAISTGDAYRTPTECETRTYELLNTAPAAALPGVTNLFRFDELIAAVAAAGDESHDVPYSDVLAASATEAHPYRRLVEHTRMLYRRDDLTRLLPLGTLEARALPGEGYQLALTDDLVAQVYADRVTNDLLQTEAGYVHSEGDTHWWIPAGRVFLSPDAADSPAEELAFAQQHFFLPHRFRDPFGATAAARYDDYDLLPLETVDPVGNRVTAGERDPATGAITNGNDYRTLQAALITDANGNRSAAAFNALGLVTGTALMGKPGASTGDSLAGFTADLPEAVRRAHLDDPLADPGAILQDASTRTLYDVRAYFRTRDDPQPRPAVAYTLARETHVADSPPGQPPRFQHAFSYSDGFGREIQQKLQAEPGPLAPGGPDVAPRWLGTGWTIYNNKGLPVREYEPFFTATHRFEFARAEGVSPILFYDPLGRVVATLHPNHTVEKVLFDAWRQTTWDANDMALVADPSADSDVGDFFRRLPDDAYLPSWHDQRIGGALGTAEQAAAAQTAAHAATPNVVCFDALGRAVLTIADAGGGTRNAARLVLDVEGKPLAVVDAHGRRVMEYMLRVPGPAGGTQFTGGYDLLGNQIVQVSMDAGERRVLLNIVGKPVRLWDAHGGVFSTRYDALQRPTHQIVQRGGGAATVAERLIYGEAHPDAGRNLRGQLFRHYDSAGVLTNERYDGKGNLVESSRQLARAVQHAPDWSALAELADPDAIAAAAAPALDPDVVFVNRARYDALNRPVMLVTPHGGATRPSVVQPVYNESNLLERVDVWLRQGAAPAAPLDPATADLHAVTDIDYNAKGQRERIAYGNGTVTTHSFDPETYRLTRLVTARPGSFAADERTMQDLRYTYDPVGNITRIQDDADTQNAVFFRNRRVEPSASYTYDPLYRLVQATGREHLGLAGNALVPPGQPGHHDAPRHGLPHPGDGNAVGTYTEQFEYDAVGNILRLVHQAESGSWTRRYAYAEPSLIEPGQVNNRLSATSLPGDDPLGPFSARYEYDAQGNITAMPHLPVMRWDAHDRLSATAQQVVNNGGTPETTYYVYDSGGERVRKVTERQAAPGQTPTRRAERIYLNGFEIYREYGGDGSTVTLERETLHIMDSAQRVALVETRTAGSDDAPAQLVRYQMGNHLGSASLELDSDARIIRYEEYYPYGGTAYQAVRSQTDTPARYRYTGKERDEETGLYYYGARYYAPWLGRWTACDPSGLADGTNFYRYVNNNPVLFVDDDGLDTTTNELMLQMIVARQRDPEQFAQFLAENGVLVTRFLSPYGYRGYCYEDPQRYLQAFDAAAATWSQQTRIPIPFPVAQWQEPDPNEVILAALPDGTGYVGRRRDFERVSQAQRARRALRTLDNIRGGIFGAIGYGLGGDEGSDVGAAFDGLATAAGGAAQARAQNRAVAPPPSRPTTTVRSTRTDRPASRREGGSSTGQRRQPRQQQQTTPRTATPRPAPLSSPAQIVQRLEGHVRTQNQRLANAIRNGNRQYLENLGLSDAQINILLNPQHRAFAAQYGNAIERAVGRAIRSDAQLSGMIVDTRNQSGTVFPTRPGGGRSLRPDFGFSSGPLQGNIIDLTTPGQRAGKLEKYHDRVIVLTYDRPTF